MFAIDDSFGHQANQIIGQDPRWREATFRARHVPDRHAQLGRYFPSTEAHAKALDVDLRAFLLDQLPKAPIADWGIDGYHYVPDGIREPNRKLLGGLIVMSAHIADDSLRQCVADFSVACWTKVFEIGEPAKDLGYRSFYAISQMTGGIETLVHLTKVIKYKRAKAFLQSLIAESATKLGLSREELEQRLVPTYGLDASGQTTTSILDYTLQLQVTSQAATAKWTQDAKKWANPPKTLKEAAPVEVQALADQVKAFKKTFEGIRKQLQNDLKTSAAYRAQQLTHLATHPMWGPMIRSLVWNDEVPFTVGENGFRDINGQPVSVRNARLLKTDGSNAWRHRLATLGLTQPFEQIPREKGRATAGIDDMLQAIYDHPDDDQARAIYADMLLEAGDPRGEFISLQLRGDRKSAGQAKRLLKEHEETWLGPLASGASKLGRSWNRGFLDSFGIMSEVPHHKSLATVRELTLNGSRVMDAFLSAPALRNVHTVYRMPPHALEGLTPKPYRTVGIFQWKLNQRYPLRLERLVPRLRVVFPNLETLDLADAGALYDVAPIANAHAKHIILTIGRTSAVIANALDAANNCDATTVTLLTDERNDARKHRGWALRVEGGKVTAIPGMKPKYGTMEDALIRIVQALPPGCDFNYEPGKVGRSEQVDGMLSRPMVGPTGAHSRTTPGP
jgi:uncharacterized protein (TIGR02996 family)